MLSDIEIAQKIKMKRIEKVAASAGLDKSEIEFYGTYKAKVLLSAYENRKNNIDGKLILITATTPTPFGEGKTTTTIGLAQALKRIGKKPFVCIREPSLGPSMGLKGGAAGGGYSQVLPMEDINLHFTGDMYMIGATHNLLAAMVDNHIYQGNSLDLDPNNITWNRVVDMNDRALRDITLRYRDVERNASFDITAASEVMAILCLSMDLNDLKEKLGNIVVGYSKGGQKVTARDIKADGAMALLLKEAIKPNLVQTIEGVPAFVHGGPFANIAHGCNSMIATKLALKLSDYVVTEAGFGSDLGAEKFFDIKCRFGSLHPSAVVLVITTKSLKWQGGADRDRVKDKNEEALKRGFSNLEAHVDALTNFGVPIIAAINKFEFDDKKEIDLIKKECKKLGIECEVSDVREKGGRGGVKLAKKVVNIIENKPSNLSLIYHLNDPIETKILKIAQKIYGADAVDLSARAKQDAKKMNELGFGNLPVCMAKTQFSLSDDHKKPGRPKGFNLNVLKMKVSSGAGFIVVFTGDIMTMPGLPKHPAAENMGLDENGSIRGLF